MKIIRKKFTGNENHSLTVIEGVDFIKSYRAHNGPAGCYFDKRAIEALIEQPGAVGVRYYYAVTEDGRKVLVLVGANAERQDLLKGEPVKRAMFNPPFTMQGVYDKTRVNHDIALEDAARLTATYRLQNPEDPKGGFFGKQALQKLLSQQECVGIRFLYGAKEDKTPVMVLVGVDTFGGDMFFGQFMEMSMGCPPFCDFNLLTKDFSSVCAHNSNAKSDIRYSEAA